MKRIFIVVATAALCCSGAFGQGVFHYAYDNAGNRISRTIVLQSRAAVAQLSELQSFSEVLSEKTVKITPNPTSGILHVRIGFFADSDTGLLELYNIGGKRILSQKLEAATSTLDISSEPTGVYILRITLNEEKSSWKIIKK